MNQWPDTDLILASVNCALYRTLVLLRQFQDSVASLVVHKQMIVTKLTFISEVFLKVKIFPIVQ